MTFKTTGLLLTVLTTALTFQSAYAVSENECDRMIASGKFPEKSIKLCLEENGESDTYKSNKAENERKRLEAKAREEKEAEAESKKIAADEARKKAEALKAAELEKSIEEREFTEADLFKKSYETAFFAFKIDYTKDPKNPKKVTLTPADALCSHLGYEKAISGSYTEETPNKEKVSQGFFVPKKILGIKRMPDTMASRNDDKKDWYRTVKWKTIKCAKLAKDIPEAIADEALANFNAKKFVEVGNAPKKDEEDDGDEVDQTKRSIAVKVTPPRHGYKREEGKESIDAAK